MKDLDIQEIDELIVAVDTEINEYEQSIKNYGKLYKDNIVEDMKNKVKSLNILKSKLENIKNELSQALGECLDGNIDI